MDDRQIRTIGVLALVLLGLVALVRFWEPDDEPLDPSETEHVWKIEQLEIARVEITHGGERLVFEREGERDWRIVEPVTWPGDAVRIEDLVSDLARIERGVPLGDADREGYGLGAEPVARIKVVDAAGVEKELVVGRDAPVGYRTYVLAPSGAVVAVSGDIGRKLGEPLSAWQDRSLFRFDPKDVTRITVRSPGGTLELAERDGGWWLEGFTRADADKVEDLVLGLRDLRFDTLLDDGVTAGGVSEPRFEVTVALEGGAAQVARVGEEGPMGALVEVEGPHLPVAAVGMVFPESLAILGMGPVDVGDPLAFPFDARDTSKVAVKLGDASWAAERSDGGWQSGGADAGDLVQRLAAVPIRYRREPVPQLTEVWGTVTLTTGGAERVVELGQVVDAEWRAARDTAGGEPYLVRLLDLDALASGEPAP